MDFKKPKNFTCTIVSISCMQFYLEREYLVLNELVRSLCCSI